MIRLRLFELCPLALCFGLLAGAVHGQATLALDGRTSVTKLMGSTLQVTVTGAPGRPAALLLDVDDGPVTILGHSVAIGLTPALLVVPLGTLPGSGTLTFGIPLPAAPGINGATIYFVAAVANPAALNGIDFSNGANVRIVDRRVELAGNNLGTYPHFEFVRAFNRGSIIRIAVDPTRYPFATGNTADVYVVASKTRTQWIANPSLTDVRGGPQTVTFTGATIQANTLTIDTGGQLAGPNEGASSGDTRIGIGYDVVIDFDQDGVFDVGGDLIDGYSNTQAGMYVVRDVAAGSTKVATGAGPYAVTEIQYSGGTFLGQDTYYPTNIASLQQLPLVVVSHGNGHQFIWYDHIGYHLASYGYIVMSHQNNTVPGSHTAAVTTLTNTDYIIGNQATIGGGVLNGHIDSSRITWIGHSRGGDGVARAYDMMFNGFTGSFPSTVTPPTNYDIDDIVLISSIAPVDFGGFEGLAPTLGGTNNGSHPHDATFHLWVAQADSDVNGCSSFGAQLLWYHLHDRATRKRQSTSLYGVGHGDYHDGTGGAFAAGPNLIGRTETHKIMRGYLLPLVSHFVKGDVPSRDFLWRQFESFRAVGSSTHVNAVANYMFQDDEQSGKYVIDDFQDILTAGPTPAVASSGATVTRTATVSAYLENRLVDAQNGFTWPSTPPDPFNGFTMDDRVPAFRSNSFGSVFEFDAKGGAQITYNMTTATARPRFDDFEYLSFRAAQGTHHPFTTAVLGDDTFTVTLEDGDGNQSSINIAAYGAGIEEPYQRTGCGTGAGWNSEFETIRIRLQDYLTNGNAVDLADITKVIFQFGAPFGSPLGRIGLDEIELTNL